MSEAVMAIRAAIETTVADIAYENDIPVVWENAQYTPTTGTPYLSAWMLPAPTRNLTIGTNGPNKYYGVFQVSIFYPQGQGPGQAAELAVEFLTTFAKGTILLADNYRITISMSYLGTAILKDGWYMVPVSVNYYCFAV